MLAQQTMGIALIAKETGLTRQTGYRIKGDRAGVEAAWLLWGSGWSPTGCERSLSPTPVRTGRLCLQWVCAVTGGAFQWVQAPPGNRPSRKLPEQLWRWRNKLKPLECVSQIGDSASVRAVTRVNADQALYEALGVKHYHTVLFTFFTFSIQILCSTWKPVSSPRPTWALEAGARRDCQGRPSLCAALTLHRFQATP
jgi:hypothetical protein